MKLVIAAIVLAIVWWWQPAVNLLGCIFFGISAIAGHVVPSSGTVLDQAASNLNTALGAACFLACALATALHPAPRASSRPASTGDLGPA